MQLSLPILQQKSLVKAHMQKTMWKLDTIKDRSSEGPVESCL